jgi:hypothetical protein
MLFEHTERVNDSRLEFRKDTNSRGEVVSWRVERGHGRLGERLET